MDAKQSRQRRRGFEIEYLDGKVDDEPLDVDDDDDGLYTTTVSTERDFD